MTITVTACDKCGRCRTPVSKLGMTILSCGHAICVYEKETKNQRGEIQCPRGCGSVYVKEVLE